jgi:hypothetical protein
MGRQACVFPGQYTTLVSHELPKQVGVFVIQRVHSKINFGLRSRRAFLHRGRFPLIVPVCMRLAWHKLFNFFVQRVPAEKWIVLLNFELLGFQLFISSGSVA